MNVEPHHLPRETFQALAAGGGGPVAIRLLADVSHSKLLLLILGALRNAGDGTEARDAGRAFDLLAAVQDRAPAAVRSVLRHPPVRAWARHAAQVLTADRGHDRDPDLGRLGVLAAAAATVARIPCTVPVRAPGGALVLPSLGRALLTGDRAVVEVTPEGTRIRRVDGAAAPAATGGALDGALDGALGGTIDEALDEVRLPSDPSRDAPGWRAMRRLRAVSDGARIDLLVDDVDPYRMPAMPNLAEPLTDAQVDQWQAALQPAWDVLVRRHRSTADEVRTALHVITPLRPPAHGAVSATGRDTFGCVAMSLPPDPESFAETFAHELGHAKLTGLLDVVQLTLPDDRSRYYAPWRDDPRPASGLLQGVYAYLGVTGFWRRERRAGASGHADSEFARWRAAARLGADTLLASGRLTAAGAEFVSGVRATLRDWERDTVPAAALDRADADNERHRADWVRRNGPVPTPA